MPASKAADVVVVASVAAALIAAVVGVALRWRARTIALAYRGGRAAGLAWSALCSVGAWLLDGLKRQSELGTAPDRLPGASRTVITVRRSGDLRVRTGRSAARASLNSLPETPSAGSPCLGEEPGEQPAEDRQTRWQGQSNGLRGADRTGSGHNDGSQPQDSPGADEQDRDCGPLRVPQTGLAHIPPLGGQTTPLSHFPIGQISGNTSLSRKLTFDSIPPHEPRRESPGPAPGTAATTSDLDSGTRPPINTCTD